MTIPRKDDDAVRDDRYGIAQISIAAADSVPILAHVSVRTKSARPVIAASVRFADRHVETIRQPNECGLSGEINRWRWKSFCFVSWLLDNSHRVGGRRCRFLRSRDGSRLRWRARLRAGVDIVQFLSHALTRLRTGLAHLLDAQSWRRWSR